MIPLLLGCTIPPAAPPTNAGPLPFPHPDGYDAPALHGADARAADAPCATCHQAGDCAECHGSYPHAPIAAGVVHPAPTDECLACHAADDTWAGANLPCTSCHPSYPHPPGFDQAGTHGVYALARGRIDLVCGTCHGADLSGGVANVACTKCHADWPHPPGWDTGHAVTTADGLPRCWACHGEDGLGGNAGVGCGECHSQLPHPQGWVPGGHAAAVAVQGEADCLQCHDPGDGPPTMFSPCGGACHGGAP